MSHMYADSNLLVGMARVLDGAAPTTLRELLDLVELHSKFDPSLVLSAPPRETPSVVPPGTFAHVNLPSEAERLFAGLWRVAAPKKPADVAAYLAALMPLLIYLLMQMDQAEVTPPPAPTQVVVQLPEAPAPAPPREPPSVPPAAP